MDYNQPLSGNEMPRFAGPATMMRLPTPETAAGLDAAFVGIPLDIGTSHRSGTRFGPRQIRAESPMLRPYNMWTRASPFDRLQVADLGDIAINPFDLLDSVARSRRPMTRSCPTAAIPLALGGDHTLTLPCLRAMAKKHGPVGLIHVDAHADVNDHMFGEPDRPWHAVPPRGGGGAARQLARRADRAARHRLLGRRFRLAAATGLPRRQAEECWHKSLTPLMAEVREQMGDGPVYISYDIDSLDPGVRAGDRHAGDRRTDHASGTGDHSRGGRAERGRLRPGGGLSPYDPGGTTALIAANLLYEMLCVLPKGRST